MVEIEIIALLLNSILIPIVIYGVKEIRSWSRNMCDRLTKIEHKLDMDHGTSD